MSLSRVFSLLLFLLSASLPSRADFSFVQITDTHVQGVPSAATSDKRVRDMFSEIVNLSPRPDLIVHTGDITESGSRVEFSAYDRIQHDTIGRMPLYAVPGNHDIRWNPLGKAAFEHDTGQPAYRSFDHDHIHFILLDSTVALEHWGHFDQTELDWLKQDLVKTGPGRPIIIGFHHWIGRTPTMVDNEDALLSLLEPYNVRLFLIGHGHSDLLWNINGAPAIMAKGLYQGSYNIVRIVGDRIQVLRRTDSDPKPTKLLVDVPLRRDTVPQRTASVETVAASENPPLPASLVASFKRGDLPAATVVTFRIDSGESTVLTPDPSGWTGSFPMDKLYPGVHRTLFTATLPDGRAYQIPVLIPLVPKLIGADLTLPTGLKQIAPEWRVNVGSAVQSALVGDGTALFIPTTSGDLIAIDIKSGKTLWHFATSGALYSPPAISENLLIFGCADETVYAVDRTSGMLQWKTLAHAPIFAGAAVSQGIAAIATTDGRILGFESRTGKQLWTARGDGMYQSRAATDNMGHFFVGGWDNYFRCLDTHTGAEQWKQKMGKSHHYSPAIGSPTVNEDGSVVYVSSDDGILHALNTATGTVIWEAPGSFGYSSPLFSAEGIFSGSLADDGSVFRLNAKTGTQEWKHATDSVIYDSSCVALRQEIVVGSVGGTVTALSASSGSIHWQYHLPPGHLLSTPWANSDHIFVANMSGDVYSFPAPTD